MNGDVTAALEKPKSDSRLVGSGTFNSQSACRWAYDGFDVGWCHEVTPPQLGCLFHCVNESRSAAAAVSGDPGAPPSQDSHPHSSDGCVDDVRSSSGTRHSLGILRCAYGTAHHK